MSDTPVMTVMCPSESSRHAGGRRFVPARPPADCEADPLALRQRPAPAPERVPTKALEALARAEHLHLLACHGLVAGDEHIAKT